MSQCQSLQCQKYINCLGLIENQNLIKELKLLTNIQSSFFTNYLDKAGLKYNYRNNIANMMFSLSICQWWELYGPLGSLHWPMVTADESVRWQECVIHGSRPGNTAASSLYPSEWRLRCPHCCSWGMLMQIPGQHYVLIRNPHGTYKYCPHYHTYIVWIRKLEYLDTYITINNVETWC